MELIVAVDRHWGIGNGNALQFRIREDLRRFREMTMGQVVVMGRSTLQTLPGQMPLEGRETILLSRNPGLIVPRAAVCHSIAELGALLRRPPYAGKTAFVVGGAQVYAQLAPHCALAHVTHVCARRPADAFFPRLSRMEHWERVSSSPWQETAEGLRYRYATYRNHAPLPLPGQTGHMAETEGREGSRA